MGWNPFPPACAPEEGEEGEEEGEEGEEGDDGEGDDGEEEEEVEVTEIEYKGKTYYVQNDVVYTKKKNGDMGKEIGVMKNGKPKLKKKDKKEN